MWIASRCHGRSSTPSAPRAAVGAVAPTDAAGSVAVPRNSQGGATARRTTRSTQTRTPAATAAAATNMDCKPDTIGFYTIDRRIGKGNFAEVRLATHRLVRSEASADAARFTAWVIDMGWGGTHGQEFRDMAMSQVFIGRRKLSGVWSYSPSEIFPQFKEFLWFICYTRQKSTYCHNSRFFIFQTNSYEIFLYC